MSDEYVFSKDLSSELEFVVSENSEPEGQNVNTEGTKVELRFSVFESEILTQEEKETLFKNLYHRIDNEGILSVTVQTEYSQSQNKQIATEKFYQWLKLALKPFRPKRKNRSARPRKN